MVGSVAPERVDDIFILVIDHDVASAASLTSMLEQFSKRVMSIDVASKALSMIEKQKKDIGLVIANIEMPHIDSHSFLTALLEKNLPLILINAEKNTKKPSDLLTKRVCFSLDKPISEIDIKNMWEHVLSRKSHELKKINIIENEENDMDNNIDQIEAFRARIKRQRTSQASLLGRRHFMINTFTTFGTYQKRNRITNVEWKPKQGYPPIENEDKNEWKILKYNVGRHQSLWTNERHMKFLAAISILGEKEFRPKLILRIMNDLNLTPRQVASHLQKYKAQVERIRDALPINEWKSTDKTFEYPLDYEYPFKASHLTKNLIVSNSLWNSLRTNSSSSSSITQFLFKNPIVERKKNMSKFQPGGKLDLSNHSRFANTKISIPQYDPNPLHPHRSIFETDASQIASIPDSFVPLADLCTMNPFETNRNQIDWVPSIEYHKHSGINMNHMDWVSSPKNYVFPETDMNLNFSEKNTNHMDLVFSGESYVLSENMIPSEVEINQMGIDYYGGSFCHQEETNTDHVDFVSCKIPYEIPPKTNKTTIETNTEEMNYATNNQGPNVPIEDLISFDDDVNEKEMHSWLEDKGYSGKNNFSSPNYLKDDFAFMNPTPHMAIEGHNHSIDMDFESTSQQYITMESCEYPNIRVGNQKDDKEGGDNFNDYCDCMDWIDHEIDKDA